METGRLIFPAFRVFPSGSMVCQPDAAVYVHLDYRLVVDTDWGVWEKTGINQIIHGVTCLLNLSRTKMSRVRI